MIHFSTDDSRGTNHRRLSVAMLKAGHAWKEGAREVRIETEFCIFRIERIQDGIYGSLTKARGYVEVTPDFSFWKRHAAAAGLPVFSENGWLPDPAATPLRMTDQQEAQQ